MSRILMIVTACFCSFLFAKPVVTMAKSLPSPQQVFGFVPGSDRRLVDYPQLIDYLQKLDQVSDRIILQRVGISPMGRPMVVLFLSASQNLEKLKELRSINQRLALDPAIPAAKRAALVRDGRVFVMMTLSMHSGEVGPSQSLPLFAHQVATTHDPEVLEQLREVVLMIVPSHNPDGMDMVVKHYRSTKGTQYEGGWMPGVYHKYVGHDNNRDFVALTQVDTRVISEIYSTRWYPQVLVEKHQMGMSGPRYFVPPNHDPIADNIDQALWRWSALFGSALAKDMGNDGFFGIAQHWAFDNYWPGSTETSLWKNVISFLTEAASTRVASPTYVEPNELQVRGKGLSEYKKSVNMPNPWPGGWWRLGDIVAYEWSSMRSILKTAALYRKAILQTRNDLCKRAVLAGKKQPPYYFVMPSEQHDRGSLMRLVKLLRLHGVAVFQLKRNLVVQGRAFAKGDVVVSLSQPYRAFVKEVLEPQAYPVRRYTPDGKMIRPYDITSWSLPLHHGIRSYQIDTRSIELEQALTQVTSLSKTVPSLPTKAWALAYRSSDNDSYRLAWAALKRGMRVGRLTQEVNINGNQLPTGSFIVQGASAKKRKALVLQSPVAPVVLTAPLKTRLRSVRVPRVALIESYFHDMDAGWTRYVFDTHGIPFTVLRPGKVAQTNLMQKFDVIVFPDMDAHVVMHGRYKEEGPYRIADYPPQYTKGLGKKGIQRLLAFIDKGGVVVAWRRAISLFTDHFKVKKEDDSEQPVWLPVTDLAKERTEKGLLVPGAWLHLRLRIDHPVTWGMPKESGAFCRTTPVMQTKLPRFDTDRRVLAWFRERELLASGYIEKPELLANMPAAVWVRKGKGQLVLFSCSPQFRASTPATYKMLFNALLLSNP